MEGMGMGLEDMRYVWGAYGLTAAVLLAYTISLFQRAGKEKA